MTAGRIVLLVTSPRLPAGLLTAQAWDLVRGHPVLAGVDDDRMAGLRAAGASVTIAEPTDQGAGGPVDALLDAVARHGTAVWLAGPGGDEDLARALGLRLVREPHLAELELVVGSWDPPGARLLDAVEVMDRLMSPGGDPWLSQHAAPGRASDQTHRGLARYLLEEAYEAYDAIEADDRRALREELGDVLLQVVLHARMAADGAPDDRFDIDDVAGDLVAKLIRRNPHVFAGAAVADLDEITENWERIKRAEKARDSALDGLALAQPALALAAKVLDRIARAGIDLPPTAPVAADLADNGAAALGAALLAAVVEAHGRGLDPEAALRRAVLDLIERVRRLERASS